MVKYIIKRLLNGLIVLLGVVTITFFITRVVPSDVAGKWAGERATEEQRKQAIAELGLDKPLVTQYVNYLKDLLSGDLGRSLRTKELITKELASYFPATMELVLVAFLFAMFVGIPMGIYSAKKNGKMRPLGIPSIDDKLVQEVLRMMLEAIYEGSFENTSHGFRPKRSCHTALIQVQKNFTAAKWFIEGDIEGFFDNINHDVLIGILKERIADDRFIRLMWKFLKAGYIEDWTFHRTYSGTPQGGIISPILANIYLDKLDKYMKEYACQFDRGDRRAMNLEYKRYSRKIWWLGTKLKQTEDKDTRKELIDAIKQHQKNRMHLPSVDEMDEGYRRIKYVRYADDFIIGVIGSKSDCEAIKEDIKNFLGKKLKLTLSEEKTLITHGNRKAKFLGYEIYVRPFTDKTLRGEKSGVLIKAYGKKVVLEVPMSTMRDKLLYYEAMEIHQFEGKAKWKPTSRTKLLHLDDLEILDAYNREIRGFANYFSIANNSSHLNSFKYIMQYSLYKTFARKYSTTARKIIAKYRHHKDFAVFYEDKKGGKKMRVFFNGSFKRKTTAMDASCDYVANTIFNTTVSSLIQRLKAGKCELCGATENIEIHHVKRLKDLKGKEPWKIQMIGRQRKTLAVCIPCHNKIHHGIID